MDYRLLGLNKPKWQAPRRRQYDGLPHEAFAARSPIAPVHIYTERETPSHPCALKPRWPNQGPRSRRGLPWKNGTGFLPMRAPEQLTFGRRWAR